VAANCTTKLAKERQRATGGNRKQKAVVENLPQPDRARDAATP